MEPKGAILAEILRHKFMAVIDDMRATLVNTAYSAAISEGRECAAAILTENGNIVATDSALQMSSLAATAADVIDYFKFNMAAADVIITNDPYGGGTRVQDFTIIAPFASGDEIVMFLAVRARMTDIGGELLGGFNPLAREIWAEGTRITPVKLVRDGRPQKDVLTTILLNTRLPDSFRLDLEAMMAAIAIGKRRLNELVDRYGLASILDAGEWTLTYADRLLAAELSTWPEGQYTGECRLRHDCQEREGVTIRAAVKVGDSHLEIDFSNSDEQSTAFVNSTYANTCGYALLPVLSVIDEATPRNSGLMKRLKIVTRKGTVVDPEFPAPTAWSRHHVGAEIAQAVIMALAQFLPGRAANVTANLPMASSIIRATRHGGTIEQLATYDYAAFCQGDCGATEDRDGWGMPGVFAERPLPSAEAYEAEGGGSVARLEFVTDSGGPGKLRGGLASEVILHLPERSEEIVLTVCLQRSEPGPYSLKRGRDGTGCEAEVIAQGVARRIGTTLINEPIGPGAVLRLRMAGGSGWGPPYERDPAAVLKDVLDEYVSIESAAGEYGVIIEPDSMVIDDGATRRKRSEMEAADHL